METAYDFLDALGLDEAATERDIRRAYARRLKEIDQEGEPGAFQALRDAYEVALDWARWKLAQEADATQADPAVPAQASPAPGHQEKQEQDGMVDAAQLGAAVYHRFLAEASTLVALPRHGEIDAWRAAIEARFLDDELFNIDARIYYEAYIAALLASGWRPGHEVLFVAAQAAFGWRENRRGLRQLGEAGQVLDQAIEERRLFEAQDASERARMRDLVRMLRQEAIPSIRRIRAAMPDVERMLARFPAFVAIVAGVDNVERWRTLYRESGAAPIVLENGEVQAPPPEPGFWTRHGAAIFVLCVVALAAFLNSGTKQDEEVQVVPLASLPRVQQYSGLPTIPEAAWRPVLAQPAYTPPPGIDSRDLAVVHVVFLDAGNRVERVQTWQTSGEPGFDRAVADALQAARPFPSDTPRVFELRYTGAMLGEAPD